MSSKSLTVLSKPTGCVQCNATYRALEKTDIAYTSEDATQPEFRQLGMDLGHMQAPVLLVHDEDGNLVDHWSGFNPGKIDELKEDPEVTRKAPVAELIAA